MSKASDEFIEQVIREVAELLDRTSPSDAPDMMLVTADELRAIIVRGLLAIGLRGAHAEQLYKA